MVPVSSEGVSMKHLIYALALPLALSGNAMAQGSDLIVSAPEGCRSGLYREISKYTVECVNRIDPDLVKRFCALPNPGDDAATLACGALEKGR
jgi:hypothetical protein